MVFFHLLGVITILAYPSSANVGGTPCSVELIFFTINGSVAMHFLWISFIIINRGHLLFRLVYLGKNKQYILLFTPNSPKYQHKVNNITHLRTLSMITFGTSDYY